MPGHINMLPREAEVRYDEQNGLFTPNLVDTEREKQFILCGELLTFSPGPMPGRLGKLVCVRLPPGQLST